MLFTVLGGGLSITHFPLDAEPDVPIPNIIVRVSLPGVSPEDAQRLLIRPMETAFKSIEGLRHMDGIATHSQAYMTLEFNASFDQNQAFSDVLEKVDRARADFPQEAEEPVVQEINTNALPVLVVNLYGQAPQRQLQTLAKDLKRRIESEPNVLEASITGERIDVLEAIIDPALVESSAISYNEIARAISRNNSLITAGALETKSGKFNVKLPGLIENQTDLAELVIRTNSDGSIIRMGDIAQIRRGYKDAQSYARFNGRKSVSIEVANRSGSNMIRTITKVRNLVIARTQLPEWPDTIQVEFSQDRSLDVITMVKTLFASILNAIILVFIVCIAALGLRSALFVGWAIPASFLMALFLMFINGEAINFMILFALILAVGVLVDSAIVIVEYADRKIAEGMNRKEAYKNAGERMFWPIISSTATTLIAFIPLLFWDEVTGKFMAYLSITMLYVLTASMIMALVFLPTLGAFLGPKKIKHSPENLRALSGTEGDPALLTGFTRFYSRLITQLIHHPISVILATIVLLTGVFWQFTQSMSGPPPKPVEFFTNTPSDEVVIIARSRGNSTPAEHLKLARDIENRIQNIPGIQSIYTTAGNITRQQTSGSSIGLNTPEDTVAKIYPQLLPFAERRKTADIMADMRKAVQNIAGIHTEVQAESQGPPIGKDITIELASNDPNLLYQNTLQVRRQLDNSDGLFEVEDTLPLPGVEWELQVDRSEAGRLGLDIATIGSAIQFFTEGSLIGKYRPLDTDEEVDIRIRYPQTLRDLATLDSLRIQTSQGALPLSAAVKRLPKSRQDKITSRDQKLVYEVKANTRPGFATNIEVAKLKHWLQTDANLAPDIEVRFLGQEEENNAAVNFFKTAGISILFMMAVVLLLQFNSFYHVFLTLLAIILSFFGVLLGLTYYPYLPMVPTVVSLLALAGIVVNNNIVLIDTYQRLRRNGFHPTHSAIRTAAQRLRPVILTTTTTMVGLFPLALGWQANIFTGVLDFKGNVTSDIFAPISYSIVVGLGFSTLLTLILTPVLLAMPTVLYQRFLPYFKKCHTILQIKFPDLFGNR